ncbi:inositol hexakisphosphate kinase 2-like isoform X2 [Dreissena polymorpha]|nr:inositol hexakisphosphate kinase 2-like isoform X2 [Dreissena polymorpha]XP_052279928.1 inositol hexakisphosphate kinase 2-like isoform X2 [Dreissena polymorpha]
MRECSLQDHNKTLNSEPVQLQPFIHQVGGHSCVLRFNETTLCKPLITREHVFYESVPAELKEFIPDYRGTIEVGLHKDDYGQITFIGYVNGGQRIGQTLHRSSPKLYQRGTSPNSSESESDASHSPVPVKKKKPAIATDNAAFSPIQQPGVDNSPPPGIMFHSPDPKGSQTAAGCNPWSVHSHKRQLAAMKKENTESNLQKFILLENVAAKFKYPCILDLKMGTRQHGDDAPESKKISQTRKCQITTSSAVGLRLIGMQVYQSTSGQYVCQNKYFGRKLTVEGFKDVLESFLFDGRKMRVELLPPILSRLRNLCQIVEKQDSFRFYSSSLLIMYGGIEWSKSDNDEDPLQSSANCEAASDCKGQPPCQCESDVVDIRMIDFAHSTHRGFHEDTAHSGVDQGYLFGVRNLIEIFNNIQHKYSVPQNKHD